jgi:hypothetical protein
VSLDEALAVHLYLEHWHRSDAEQRALNIAQEVIRERAQAVIARVNAAEQVKDK